MSNPGRSPDLGDVARTVGSDETSEAVVRVPSLRTGWLTVLAALLAVATLYLARPVLVPVVFALLISYALDPVVTSLSRWHVPRGLAAALVLTSLLAATSWLAYSLRDDVGALAERLPRVAEKVRGSVHDMKKGTGGTVARVQQAASAIESAAAEAAPPPPAPHGVTRVQIEQPALKIRDLVVSGSLGMVELAADAVVVFFLALYLLAAGDLFKRKLVGLVGPSLSEKKATVQILADIDRQVGTFLLMRLAICSFVAIATWLPLRVLGMEQAGLWGVLAGALNIVPYLGPTTVTLGIGIAGFVQFGTLRMGLLAGGISVVVSILEGYLVTPWLTSRAARMNAVAVFLGLLFWGWVWGLPGLLLAVPLVMVLKAICDRVEGLKAVGELLGE